jgi:hypothetical protein
MFFATVIVIASLLFVLAIIKMSLNHYERIQRIRHGYPINGDIPHEGFIPHEVVRDEERFGN